MVRYLLQRKRRTDSRSLYLKDVRWIESADDAQVQSTVCYGYDQILARLTFQILDAEFYPTGHIIRSTYHDCAPVWLSPILHKIPALGAVTLQQMLSTLLSEMTSVVGSFLPLDRQSDCMSEDEEDGNSVVPTPVFNWANLERQLKEIMRTGYRPGYIHSESALSISIPVPTFFASVPPQSLLAWDKRLFAGNQYITLVLTDIHQPSPLLWSDDSIHGANMFRFKVGMTRNYKPDLRAERGEVHRDLQPFDLSAIMEDIMDTQFEKLLKLRIQHSVSWASAENMYWTRSTTSKPVSNPLHFLSKEDEIALLGLYGITADSCSSLKRDSKGNLNLPLIAFRYLLRRLILSASSKACDTCHRPCLARRVRSTCHMKSCLHRVYHEQKGRSLEYAILFNPEMVDFLVSMTYIAAEAGVLHPLPINIGLCIPPYSYGTHDTTDFDALTVPEMCAIVRKLISELPSVSEMQKYLNSLPYSDNTGVEDMDTSIPAASWMILRWSINACPVRIEEARQSCERIRGIGPEWRQLRITVGTPNAEVRFRSESEDVQKSDINAQKYPSLYAFHGSPLDSWLSIIHYGLWYKSVRHGRKYGDGVYLSKEATIAENYTRPDWEGSQWRNSAYRIEKCMALAEVVNSPAHFVYDYKTHGPKSKSNKKSLVARNVLVVDNTDWIMCRYLLVKSRPSATPLTASSTSPLSDLKRIPLELDPKHLPTINKVPIGIPNYSAALGHAVARLKAEYREDPYDALDSSILSG
ncbi:hypothetical protein C8Q76DRAFT_752526 [Earliella scabrosa]|nr:hypothetical protein C8Q76DRAFT_752526 [Earliella scabrosa]